MSDEATILRARATACTVARRALQGDITPIIAARELSALRFRVGVPEDDPDFLTFVGIESETDALPLGPVRKYWALDSLAEKDKEIALAEAWAMEVGTPAFKSVISRFGTT